MKLQNDRKNSDHIYITVYSQMKLLQLSGSHIEKQEDSCVKPRSQNFFE